MSGHERAPTKTEIMNEVRQQMAMVSAQGLIGKITDKCFTKCISKPGADLGTSDKACVSKCMDRYLEAFQIVAQTYGRRLQSDLQQDF